MASSSTPVPTRLLRVPDGAPPGGAGRGGPVRGEGIPAPMLEPLQSAEDAIDAINRVIERGGTPRERVYHLLADYERLLRDHASRTPIYDVQLILHNELDHPKGPRIVERYTFGPVLDKIEPRPDADVQAVIDNAAPVVRMVIPDAVGNVRKPRVFVVSQDLPVTYRGWWEREIVAKHLTTGGWNELMLAVWASGPDSMIGITTYNRPGLPRFGPRERRLAGLMLRAAAPMLYREFFDNVPREPASEAAPAEPRPATPAQPPSPTPEQPHWDPLLGHDLSDRQRDVLRLLLRGHSEKEVANELGLSAHTVHTHVKRLYSEFEVSSRGELLALFVDRRLLDAA